MWLVGVCDEKVMIEGCLFVYDNLCVRQQFKLTEYLNLQPYLFLLTAIILYVKAIFPQQMHYLHLININNTPNQQVIKLP